MRICSFVKRELGLLWEGKGVGRFVYEGILIFFDLDIEFLIVLYLLIFLIVLFIDFSVFR